jgi:hypothetical protein
MPETEDEKQPMIGTPAYDNWRAFSQREPLLSAFECILYTDAWLTGEVITGVGPYSFFNLVPILLQGEEGKAHTAVVLRIGVHAALETTPMDKTDQARYHGGSMTDEIAALASLLCGVRFRSGGQTREFDVKGDPRGRPVAWSVRPEPTLMVGMGRWVLPRATGEHSMMPIQDLRRFPMLNPEEAIALVRSARLYQDALWLAESEPSLSWLMLVAAVETAAGHWRISRDSPLDRLRGSKPGFVEFLVSTGVENLALKVAEEFDESIGATKKFVDFLLTYLPTPPPRRPAKWGQIEWSPENLRKALRQIYTYRSKSLHNGMPFPAPMCEPAFVLDIGEAPTEKPIGTAMSTAGGTWLAEDVPMLLHTFEYIARNGLIAWWKSMTAT